MRMEGLGGFPHPKIVFSANLCVLGAAALNRFEPPAIGSHKKGGAQELRAAVNQ